MQMRVFVFIICLPIAIAHCLLPPDSVMPGGEPTALCRGASRQRYAGGRADSVMPSQRYAFPALCLAATGGCLPKIATCPRNRSSGGF